MLRDRLIQDTRRVGAQQMPCSRPHLVDTVVADAEARDDAAGRKRIVERAGVLTAPHDDVPGQVLSYRSRELVLDIGYTPAFQPGSGDETGLAFTIFSISHEHGGFCVRHVSQNLPLTRSQEAHILP